MNEQEFLEEAKRVISALIVDNRSIDLGLNDLDFPKDITDMKNAIQKFYGALSKKYGKVIETKNSTIQNAINEFYKEVDSYSNSEESDYQNVYDALYNAVMSIEGHGVSVVKNSDFFKNLKNAERYNPEKENNVMDKNKLLENAASKFRLESARFDSTVNKFRAAFPHEKFEYNKITWDGDFGKFSSLISNMVRLIEYMHENVNKNNGDTTPVVAAKKNVETAVNNLIEALKQNTEDAIKKANEHLNTIVNNTKLANQNTLMSFESFEILNSEKKKVKGREEKEDGTFKRIIPRFKKRKDKDKEKKGIKKLNVKKVMEPNASNEKMISLSLKDDSAVKCLEHMNEKIKPLIKRCRYIFPGREYKEAKSFVEMRALLSEIYETSKELLKEEPDTEIFNGFDDALNEYEKTPKTPKNSKNSEDSNGIGSITKAFDDLLEKVLEVAKRAAKLGKKADQELQKSLEPIFEKKIPEYFSKEEEKDGAVEKFNKIHLEFKLKAEERAPKWYKFMETMCLKNKIKNPTNGALMALLLISCCAADDISKADAICRSIRKIIKDPALKDKKYIKAAEKIRQDIKNKISVVDDIKSLYKYLKDMNYTNLVDKPLSDKMFKEARKSHQSLIKRLFSH